MLTMDTCLNTDMLKRHTSLRFITLNFYMLGSGKDHVSTEVPRFIATNTTGNVPISHEKYPMVNSYKG